MKLPFHGCTAMLLLAATLPARAEDLAILTEDRLSLRDSAGLSIERDFVTYSLPRGYAAIGADQDPDDDRFYVLARNASSGLCQVYFLDGANAAGNGPAPISAAGPGTACSADAGDLEFILSDPGFDAGWLFGDGAQIVSYDPEARRYDRFDVRYATGGSPDIAGIAMRGRQGALASLVLDSANDALSSIAGFGNSITLGNSQIITPAFVRGRSSLDISEATGAIYLLTDGQVHRVGNGGMSTDLGPAPSNSVAVLAISGQIGGEFSDEKQIVNAANTITLGTSAGRFALTLASVAPASAPADFTYPFGWVAFTITDLAPGQSVSVTLRVDNSSATPDAYVKCSGPNGSSCASFTRAEFAPGTATMRLTDGGPGDDDGIANGTIVDPGALAVSNTPAVGDSGGGAIGAGLLSVLMAASLYRRRRPTGN